MARRLVIALLLSAWFLGGLGCGGGSGPVEQTTTFKEQRPRLPQPPGGQKK
jgi:hypothetical protein